MSEKNFTQQEQVERVRLRAWMKANDHTPVTIAAKTGDFYNNIYMMTEGKRRISQSFKWRLRHAFGNQVVDQIFVEERPITEVELA